MLVAKKIPPIAAIICEIGQFKTTCLRIKAMPISINGTTGCTGIFKKKLIRLKPGIILPPINSNILAIINKIPAWIEYLGEGANNALIINNKENIKKIMISMINSIVIP